MTARLVPADPVFPNNVEREVCERLVRNLRAFIGRFEELGREWGLEIDADRNESEFWEKELPAQMAALAQNLPEGKKFDAIIVDEAQDFAEDWWIPLLAALKNPEEGGLFVYSDENQRVFARFGRPPVQLVPLVLDHNLRNTKQIAESFSSLAPMRMRSLGGDGAELPPGGPRPGGLLAHLLGERRCLLRPRPRLQGPGAPRRGPLRQRGSHPRPVQGATVCRAVPSQRTS